MQTLASKGHTRPAARFVPVGFSPVTLFLSADDLAALERKANSYDVVQFVTQHIRRKLLSRKGGGN